MDGQSFKECCDDKYINFILLKNSLVIVLLLVDKIEYQVQYVWRFSISVKK